MDGSHSGNASDKTTMPAAAVKIRQLCLVWQIAKILFMLVTARFIQTFYRTARICSGFHARLKILKKCAY